jgi:hypothetical protein
MSDRAETAPTRDDVVAAVGRDFPKEDPEVVLAVLDRYGLKGFHRERERIHLAILRLSEGDLRQVIQFTKAAEEDYRDVLWWASDNPPPKMTEEEAQKYARGLMQRLGVDPDNPPKWTPAHVVCPVCGEGEPVAQIVWCDNRPMRDSFPEIPIRRREDPYRPTGNVQRLQEIGFDLLCRNNHRWSLTAHLGDRGVEWEIIIIDQG